MIGAAISFVAATTNTGAATLNIGQTTGGLLGPKAIRNQNNTAIAANSIVAGRHVQLRYDSSLDSGRSEEHTSELQSLMRISYAVFCLKKNIIMKRETDNCRKRHTVSMVEVMPIHTLK